MTGPETGSGAGTEIEVEVEARNHPKSGSKTGPKSGTKAGRGRGKGGGKSQVLWASVRRHYEMDLGTVADICAQFKVSQGALYYRRKSEGWQKRRSGSLKGAPTSENSKEQKSPRRLKREVSAPGVGDEISQLSVHSSDVLDDELEGRTVGTRLYEVLEIKLAEIEDRIARGEQLTVEENEREQRVIGNLIRNFDKLTEFNERRTGGTGKKGQAGKKAHGDGDAGADLTKLNAVQFREEIARRIKHFEKGRKS